MSEGYSKMGYNILQWPLLIRNEEHAGKALEVTSLQPRNFGICIPFLKETNLQGKGTQTKSLS